VTGIRPPRLQAGDRVALLAPAGPVTAERLDTAIVRCRRLGLQPAPGAAVRRRSGYLAGPDASRAADFQAAVRDDDVAAIWAVRGGYGTMRLLASLDLEPLRRRPKPFIGFSDNTALHLALQRLGLVSFHGPHAGFPDFPEWTEACFRSVLMADRPAGVLPAAPSGSGAVVLRGGRARGRLLGGNLSLLAALCGTAYQPRCRGRILFIEDVAEPVYRIDRMLTQLQLAGVLDGAAGFALGLFTRLPEGQAESLERLLRSRLSPLGVPAVLGLPFGHAGLNWTLPLGVDALLDGDAATLELLEPAVE
jgi:muramoyltetrapeptide carboxypeptidase